MWTIYQDSPEYGCDDNPSFKWYAYRTEGNGHILTQAGPFESYSVARAFTVRAEA